VLAGPGAAGRAAALLIASGLILAACTARHGSTDGAGHHRAAGPLPAAGALLASPGVGWLELSVHHRGGQTVYQQRALFHPVG
jgi:hypothetical protein